MSGAEDAKATALLAAYRATEYRARDAAGEAGVRIGAHSAAFDALLARNGARRAAFVTAWNPGSEPRPEAENRAAGERLAEAARAMDLRTLPQSGVPDGEDWAPEEGLLLLDATREQAVAIAERFGQNAIVWVERGKVGELAMTGAGVLSRVVSPYVLRG
jgi:Protein of unknown function (DUF3293)